MSEDLWPGILSNLPVKSLLRFRTVTKSWRELIDDPNFARLHLTRFKNNLDETQLMVVQGGFRRKEYALRCSNTLEFKTMLSSLQSCIMSMESTSRNNPALAYVTDWYLVSSTDGLIIVKNIYEHNDHTADLVLWNPSIRKARMIPSSPRMPDLDMCGVDWGLGFDPSINDYKHIRFIIEKNYSKTWLHYIAIYTLGSNSWRTIPVDHGKGSYNYRRYCEPYSKQSIYFNGVLYVMAWSSSARSYLVSFDLNSEVLAFTNFPEESQEWNEYGKPENEKALTLVDGGCSLAMVDFGKTESNVWVLQMKSMSWIKRYTFSSNMHLPNVYTNSFLYLKKNGEMLVRWRSFMTLYNVETHEEKIINDAENPYMYAAYGYQESLLLLK